MAESEKYSVVELDGEILSMVNSKGKVRQVIWLPVSTYEWLVRLSEGWGIAVNQAVAVVVVSVFLRRPLFTTTKEVVKEVPQRVEEKVVQMYPCKLCPGYPLLYASEYLSHYVSKHRDYVLNELAKASAGVGGQVSGES